MVEHTEGPWKYREDGSDAFDVYSEDYGGIAFLHDPMAPEMNRMDELEANAALIAAAPDLLAACKFVVDFSQHHEDCPHSLRNIDKCDCWVGKCKEAIAKAKAVK